MVIYCTKNLIWIKSTITMHFLQVYLAHRVSSKLPFWKKLEDIVFSTDEGTENLNQVPEKLAPTMNTIHLSLSMPMRHPLTLKI